jgi:hypothetical protein
VSSTNIHRVMQCPQCHTPVTLRLRPVIDSVRDPELFHAFLQDRLNPKACPSCHLALTTPTPIVVNGRHWAGVVLENPYPIPEPKAFEIVKTLTEGLGIHQTTPSKPILVVSAPDEMRRILANRRGDRFCALALPKLGMRNHAILVETLRALTDAWLAADRPEQAYWLLHLLLEQFNELYMEPDFHELMEMTALAAGNRMPRGFPGVRRVHEDWRIIQSTLESRRRPVPAWYWSTYLCFYENGSGWRWADQEEPYLWSTVVDLLSLTSDGVFDLGQAERHQVSGLGQAIAQPELSLVEQAQEALLYLLSTVSDNEEAQLPAIPEDVEQVGIRWANITLQQRWQCMNATERADLVAFHEKLTGCDLRALSAFREDSDRGDGPYTQFLERLEDCYYSHGENLDDPHLFPAVKPAYLDQSDEELDELVQLGELDAIERRLVRAGQWFAFLVGLYVMDCQGYLAPELRKKADDDIRDNYGHENGLRSFVPLFLHEHPVYLKELIQGLFDEASREALETSREAPRASDVAEALVKKAFRSKVVDHVRRLAREAYPQAEKPVEPESTTP